MTPAPHTSGGTIGIASVKPPALPVFSSAAQSTDTRDAVRALLVEPAGEVEAVLIGGRQQVEGRGEAGLAAGGDLGSVAAGEGAGAESPLRIEHLEQSHGNPFRSGTPPTAAAARW